MSAPVPELAGLFLLKKRGLWWRPHSRGYAEGVLYAGTYSREEAEASCGDSGGEVTMVSLEQALAQDLTANLDATILRAALAKTEGHFAPLAAKSALARRILEIDQAYPSEPGDEASPAEMGVPGDEWRELVALARAEEGHDQECCLTSGGACIGAACPWNSGGRS